MEIEEPGCVLAFADPALAFLMGGGRIQAVAKGVVGEALGFGAGITGITVTVY